MLACDMTMVGGAHVWQLPGCTWLMQHLAGPLQSTVKISLTTNLSSFFFFPSFFAAQWLLFINEVLWVVVIKYYFYLIIWFYSFISYLYFLKTFSEIEGQCFKHRSTYHFGWWQKALCFSFSLFLLSFYLLNYALSVFSFLIFCTSKDIGHDNNETFILQTQVQLYTQLMMALTFALIKQMLKFENRSKYACDLGSDLWISSLCSFKILIFFLFSLEFALHVFQFLWINSPYFRLGLWLEIGPQDIKHMLKCLLYECWITFTVTI